MPSGCSNSAVPTAAIAYAGGGRGGAFIYYPDGPTGPARSYRPRHNTALMLDVDAILHGVDVVEGDRAMAQAFRPAVQIEAADGDAWVVRSADGSRVFAEYMTDELRYSVSWKACCFADGAERATWRSHADDLDLHTIEEILVKDLDLAGRLPGGEPPSTDEELRTLAVAAYGATGWHGTELRKDRPDSAG